MATESNKLTPQQLVANWPPGDVLRQLAAWAAHLNDTHDCDCQGWEARSFLIDAALIYAELGMPALFECQYQKCARADPHFIGQTGCTEGEMFLEPPD